MRQVAMRYWNEIAETGLVKREPWATLFRLPAEELSPALEKLDAELEKAGADARTILGYRLVAPLLLENVAVSAYIEQTGQTHLRSSMPELLDLTEAVMLASQEYRLSESQQLLLRKLLAAAYRKPAAQSASAPPTASPSR